VSGRRLFWIALAGLVALSWWSVERASERMRANLVLQAAETRGAQIAAQLSTLGPQARPLLAANLQALREVVDRAPADPRIPLAIGSHYLLLDNPTEAIEWYRRALEVEPLAEINLNLGRAERLAGAATAALEHFRTAVALDPTLAPSLPAEVAGQLAPP
jgi:tetratricopeptide (TPR) repeat protein